ncbi:hypothetical protein EWM64_g506 [Hericium alpestre]|uniref:C2H2-type domain-containing protein n=1 Tax=Hericium alpestre TaxID=135208 RepID=A0A4Z0AAZ5_9AGAM|nr:hypothetical protein EWM64_g506 [Hericium alpestre]
MKPREIEDTMQVDEGNDSGDEDEPPKKRRRGGELGRDWKCEEEGCEKDFKSKKALTTHHAITHLGRRDFVCSHASCGRAFGYKHLLLRHVARIHRKVTSSSSEEDEQADAEMSGTDGEGPAQEPETKGKPTVPVDIDAITGKAYEVRTQTASAHTLRCPYPEMRGLEDTLAQLAIPSDAEDAEMISWRRGGTDPCDYVFNRAYDLRRHLKAVHEVELEKEVVDAWAKRQRHRVAL